jgi:hypothetical protein
VAIDDGLEPAETRGPEAARVHAGACPEAAPTSEALDILRGVCGAQPDLAPELERVIETLEVLRAEVAGLRHASTARSRIDEAKGILISERACDEQAAFLILKQLSQETNVPVCDVARAIIFGAQSAD